MSSRSSIFKRKSSWQSGWLASLVLILLLSSHILSANANSLAYSAPSTGQNGSFYGDIPIKQIGSLLLPKGLMKFQNNEVSILAVPDWLFDRDTVLSGALVKGELELQGVNSKLHGLVYFTDGQWLAQLGSVNAPDIIDTVSGERLRGRIRSSLGDAFAFKPIAGPMQKIPFKEIKNISSPRAYFFTVMTDASKINATDMNMQFETKGISFSPALFHGRVVSRAKLPKSTLSGTEPGITTGQIAALTTVNMITDFAPAVVIPLVLNRNSNAQAQRTLNLYESEQNRAVGIPVPLNFSTSAP